MTNASAAKRGFTFQDCASMVLFLDRVKDIDRIRIEGKKEDIELFLKNGTKIYSQCKSCKIDNWDKKYKDCFIDALRTMSDADEEGCVGLIYTTNIMRPLGPKAELGDFTSDDRWIKYSELSIKSKKLVDQFIKQSGYNINTDKLSFRIIGFTGEERNKTEVIYRNIREFIGNSRISHNVDINSIFSLWLDIVTFNSSDEDTSKTITKKQIIWLFIENQMDMTPPSFDFDDYALEEELKASYCSLIDQYVERVDFTSKVLSDYNEWSMNNRGHVDEFINNSWISYKEDLEAPTLGEDYQKILITIILKKIINLREFIRKVKEATDL